MVRLGERERKANKCTNLPRRLPFFLKKGGAVGQAPSANTETRPNALISSLFLWTLSFFGLSLSLSLSLFLSFSLSLSLSLSMRACMRIHSVTAGVKVLIKRLTSTPGVYPQRTRDQKGKSDYIWSEKTDHSFEWVTKKDTEIL